MPVISYSIACTKKELIAPGVYELRFTKPEDFSFTAGQFVLFDVPLVENPSDIQTRAYSIASAPAEADLLFVIKITPGGRTSRWIEKTLRVGSTVVMKGPFGRFIVDRSEPKKLLFVCTGAGVAPFRSQIKWLLEEEGETRPMELIFGARTKKDVFWTQEFLPLMQRFPNFRYHLSLTSGEPDWDGHRGRVQVIAPQIMGSENSQWSVFICGAPDMVKDVKEKCLNEWKLEKADVHAEGYI